MDSKDNPGDLPDLEKQPGADPVSKIVDSEEGKSSLFVCGVCFESYDESDDFVPRILLCGHTLCTKDIKNLIKKEGIRCPFCHQISPVKNVSDCEKNALLVELQQKLKEEEFGTQCENCDATQSYASIWCPTCSASYCSSCSTRIHSFAKALRKHVPVPLQDRSDPKCEKHSTETLSIFCLTCKTPICNLCFTKLGDHTEHEVKLFDKEEDAQRLVLNKHLSQINKDRIKLIDMNTQIAGKIKNLDDKSISTEDMINKEFEGIAKTVRDRQQDLLRHLATKKANATAKLQEQRRQLATLQTQSETLAEEIKLVNDRKGIAMLLQIKGVTEHYNNVHESVEKLELKEVYSSGVVTSLDSQELRKSIQKFAFVDIPNCPAADISSCTERHTSLRIEWKSESKWISWFELQFKITSEDNWSDVIKTKTAFHTTENLRPETSYDFRVKAVYQNDEESALWSSVRAFATKGRPPLAPEIDTVPGISNVTVSWKFEEGQDITDVQVGYSKEQKEAEWTVLEIDKSLTSTVISGLQLGSYVVRVRSKNGAGWGNYSTESAFKVTPPVVTNHVFKSEFDENGVIYHIGTSGGKHDFKNPSKSGEIVVMGDNAQHGDVNDLVDRKSCALYSDNKENSWFGIDLGQSRKLRLTHYSARHGYSNGSYRMKNWRFEGSSDDFSPPNNWIVLKDHNNDGSLNGGAYCTASWEVDTANAKKQYRHFRFIMTGANSDGNNHLMVCSMELYGELTEVGKVGY